MDNSIALSTVNNLWQFIILFCMVGIIGLVKFLYPQGFGLIFKLFYRKNYAEEFFAFQLKRSSFFSFALMGCYNLGIAMLLYFFLEDVNLFGLEGLNKYGLILICLMAFREIKVGLTFLLGYLTEQSGLSERFITLKKMHHLMAGVLLIPFVAMATYGHPGLEIWQLIGFALAALFLAISSLRATWQIVVEMKLYHVYVILYFCALEIIPVALLVKTVSGSI